ncbi:MlaC/ttg2D family ABC transporter substrate-binding protein [Henriciella marina]|nr:ABC transporter substrate-binding protein [Henriciella marina]
MSKRNDALNRFTNVQPHKETMMTHAKGFTSKLRAHMAAGAFLAAGAVAFAPIAQAANEDHDAALLVTDTAAQAVTALDDQVISDDEADRVLSNVDIDAVAKFTLGNKWANISADEQSRYVDAFRVFARNQMKEHLSGLSGADVKVTDVIARGDKDAIVVTQVRTAGNDLPQEMSWRVMANGSWHIVDIQAQDIWFAIEQRAQFGAILDRNNGDIDALINEISS